MCLAVPGRIIACDDAEALVDLQGNRLRISKVLTPEAGVGHWVLVHAGFAITTLDEQDALETWDYLRAAENAADETEPLGETTDKDAASP
jgi:hydrogenase expression/formation protein HypC